jgi:hypothetical protein
MSTEFTFLYDQAIESLARLHAFQSMQVNDLGRTDDVEGDVDYVAEMLVRRDLLIFSASTRNFAEACEAAKEMRATAVPTSELVNPPRAPFFIEGSQTITLYQALSRLLHSKTMMVCRSSGDYEYLLATSREHLLRMISSRRGLPAERTEPIIAIESEKDPRTYLRLRSIVIKSCEFFNRVSDRLAEEEQIILPREYRALH